MSPAETLVLAIGSLTGASSVWPALPPLASGGGWSALYRLSGFVFVVVQPAAARPASSIASAKVFFIGPSPPWFVDADSSGRPSRAGRPCRAPALPGRPAVPPPPSTV